MNDGKSTIREAKIVTQTPERKKMPKIMWVFGAILLLFLIVVCGLWLASTVTGTPINSIDTFK